MNRVRDWRTSAATDQVLAMHDARYYFVPWYPVQAMGLHHGLKVHCTPNLSRFSSYSVFLAGVSGDRCLVAHTIYSLFQLVQSTFLLLGQQGLQNYRDPILFKLHDRGMPTGLSQPSSGSVNGWSIFKLLKQSIHEVLGLGLGLGLKQQVRQNRSPRAENTKVNWNN